MGDVACLRFCDDSDRRIGMSTNSTLTALSNGLADAVAAAAPAVVQVHGRRRPISGVVYADGVVVTSARALGRGDAVHVRRHDGTMFDAELIGWDPTTGLAVLRVEGLGTPSSRPSDTPPRVGHLGIAIARSWSNNVTASAGIVAVIGGPLATGRRRAIEEVIRTTAPMHDGFAGGAFVDAEGRLIGVATAAEIRGLGVVIPARIVWQTAASLLEHGQLERGYLGIAGQPATLPAAQRQAEDRADALVVVGVTPDSPAAAAGVLVGDLLLDFDGQAIGSPEDLLDLLVGHRVGRAVPLRILRGTAVVTATVTVGKRPKV
jgi:serine protease DegQ